MAEHHNSSDEGANRGENGASRAAGVSTSHASAPENVTLPAVDAAREVDAQFPMGDQVPHVGHRDTTAAGLHAIYQTAKIVARHGIARSVHSLAVLNKKGGVDCPSCAWPDPDGERSFAEFCENGAKAVAWEATSKRVTADFFRQHSIKELATKTEQWLGDQGRLTKPMVLRHGSEHYEPISWNEAFQLIAQELNQAASPDEALFYTSGRASNEAAFMYQLFVRQYGTNNLPDCSNMCHESSGFGLNQTIGVGKGTVKLSDFEHADCILIIGQNPGTNHPRMLSELERASRRGCKIISINPLLETGMMRFSHPQHPLALLGRGTPIACMHLPVRINGDVAVLKGIMKELFALEAAGQAVLDHEFIRAKTSGFEAFAADLERTTWDEIVESAGVSAAQIREVAQVVAHSQRLISCWAMGLTQHRNGVANVQSVVNLHLLRGQLGKVGAGVCPVRGHSNVQGDRTMGIYEKMNDRFMQALGREFNFTPPARHGFDVVRGLQAMHEGKIRVFIGLGGNLLSASPDTEYVADAFRRTKLSVQISTKLNRNHLVTGDQGLILPCLGRTERDVQAGGEQFVSCENSMGVVQQSRGVLQPASSELRSETSIICHIAAATLYGRSQVDWLGLCGNYDRIREHIEHVVPGFDNYNVRVREPGGFYLPNAVRDQQQFNTSDGKAQFTVHAIPKIAILPGQLLLMTIRSHDQFNTTIYGDADRYRGIVGGRRVVFLNRDDMRQQHLVPDQWVDLTSHFDGIQRTAHQFKVVPYDIPRGCAAAYFPEANPLVPVQHVAQGSNQPASKSIVITLAPAANPAARRGAAVQQAGS